MDINLEKGSLILGGILSGSKSYGAETLTVVYANPDNDQGDPKEIMTRYNVDPSWCAEIKEFCGCIIKNRPITSGTSDDALQTMKIVYKIYYADKKWRRIYDIKNPKVQIDRKLRIPVNPSTRSGVFRPPVPEHSVRFFGTDRRSLYPMSQTSYF
ncbi:MAG: hypothetical protein HOK29_13435 [Candidatus Marinimicrobia bacterium]|nr:hypothetical protein [Candidatus Neomarinimicrobiota bacterium]